MGGRNTLLIKTLPTKKRAPLWDANIKKKLFGLFKSPKARKFKEAFTHLQYTQLTKRSQYKQKDWKTTISVWTTVMFTWNIFILNDNFPLIGIYCEMLKAWLVDLKYNVNLKNNQLMFGNWNLTKYLPDFWVLWIYINFYQRPFWHHLSKLRG